MKITPWIDGQAIVWYKPNCGRVINMSYDPKCYDLAEAFLEDYAKDLSAEEISKARDELAQCIQTTIEGYLSHLDPEDEPQSPSHGYCDAGSNDGSNL